MSKPSTSPAFEAAAKDRPKYPPPFSMRLTWEERAHLDHLCNGKPWSTYIRQTVLKEAEAPRRKPSRLPKADDVALSRTLGALGQSRLAAHLNQIAKAAHLGTLPVTPDLAEDLRAACAEIQSLRADLIAALGLTPKD